MKEARRKSKNTVRRRTHVPHIVDQEMAVFCSIGHRFDFERDARLTTQCGHINRKRDVARQRVCGITLRNGCYQHTIELHRRHIVATYRLGGLTVRMQAQVRRFCGDSQGRGQNRRLVR